MLINRYAIAHWPRMLHKVHSNQVNLVHKMQEQPMPTKQKGYEFILIYNNFRYVVTCHATNLWLRIDKTLKQHTEFVLLQTEAVANVERQTEKQRESNRTRRDGKRILNAHTRTIFRRDLCIKMV